MKPKFGKTTFSPREKAATALADIIRYLTEDLTLQDYPGRKTIIGHERALSACDVLMKYFKIEPLLYPKYIEWQRYYAALARGDYQAMEKLFPECYKFLNGGDGE